MKYLRFVSLPALLVLLTASLTACGGDTPTVTPLPTSTVGATATIAAPAAAPATNTSAPAAQATDTAPAAAAATLTVAPATSAPVVPGGSISGADKALIQQALTTTKQLKSYHFIFSVTGDTITQTTNVEGDFVGPDKVYAKGVLDGKNSEMLRISSTQYMKDASGKWVIDAANSETPLPATETPAATDTPEPGTTPVPADTSGSSAGPVDLSKGANILNSMDSAMLSAADYRDAGTETLDGTNTRHFAGTLSAAKMAATQGVTVSSSIPPVGTIDLWIDPQTGYMHKLDENIDFGAAMQAIMSAMQPTVGPGTPAPPTATVDAATVTSSKIRLKIQISKPNDTSLTVPTP